LGFTVATPLPPPEEKVVDAEGENNSVKLAVAQGTAVTPGAGMKLTDQLIVPAKVTLSSVAPNWGWNVKM
jgi:hypothetical protein